VMRGGSCVFIFCTAKQDDYRSAFSAGGVFWVSDSEDERKCMGCVHTFDVFACLKKKYLEYERE
uniref:hypothetical protein n=1 Tax=Vibrio vulnificus TaxID=672 RepID=UPI0019D4234A